jgi:hypothetical protein
MHGWETQEAEEGYGMAHRWSKWIDQPSTKLSTHPEDFADHVLEGRP